jgi:hypothetical protein
LVFLYLVSRGEGNFLTETSPTLNQAGESDSRWHSRHLPYLAVDCYPTLRKLIILKVFTICSHITNEMTRTKLNMCPVNEKESKDVPLHAMEAHGGRGGIAPTHT